MKRLQKIIIISFVSILFLAIIGVVIAQKLATSKIEKFLTESLPDNIQVDYETLDVSILSGSVSLGKPKLTMYAKTTDSIILTNDMESIHVENIGYWDYLVNDKIIIESIQIKGPQVNFSNIKRADDDVKESSKEMKQIPNVKIQKFSISNGNFSMFDVKTDSLMLKLTNFNFDLFGIEYHKEAVGKNIPVKFTEYELTFDDMFYSMNDYDNIKVGKSKFTKNNSDLSAFRLYTKYSKQELSKMISVERDHVDLKIKSLEINDHEFGFHQDSIFYFKSPKVVFENPVLDIYRDKLIADDTEIKYLYSKLLRELKFDLTLSEVLLKNGAINYSEKVKSDHSAGELKFSNMDVTIANLSNTYSDSVKTDVDLNATFMKSTPIHVNWYFDVNNVNDHFIFKADIGNLPAQDLNPFSKPNLNVEFEGELSKTYMTVDGNAYNSNVDFRANYDEFKVSVLEKDGKDKNSFLSVVANLFIKKDSNEASDDFREGSKENVERDNTKSIFNFVWLNARAGLLSVLTGNGKK